MKKLMFLCLLGSFITQNALAFCGFYVAKADASLFNKASQVILVRDGEQLSITMSNDFQGEVNDFAMVVPVPEVLQKKQIQVVERRIFDKLDAYSAPRLVEYYDESPCEQYLKYEEDMDDAGMAMPTTGAEQKESTYGVTIQAKYTVGEYDILILDAKQSTGLERWLIENGYKIPKQARTVLTPYIKSNMKFFVVKVNLAEHKKMQDQLLRPIQITFKSPKFMLPIRLGMANAKDFQDLIIYSFTKTGRTECSNYQTLEMPTGQDVPIRTLSNFADFYKAVFDKQYKTYNQSGIFLEYAWQIRSQDYFPCDPCVSDPPVMSDLQTIGVNWMKNPGNNQNYDYHYGGYADFEGQFCFTRLHVRYDRAHFAQDLVFQETPNTQNFQSRYVIHHKVDEQYLLDCAEAPTYLEMVKQREIKEEENYQQLTALNTDMPKSKEEKQYFVPPFFDKNDTFRWEYALIAFLGITSLIVMVLKNRARLV